jgi:hypothetical protein
MSIANDEMCMFAADANYSRGKAHKLLQAAHRELFEAGPGDCPPRPGAMSLEALAGAAARESTAY